MNVRRKITIRVLTLESQRGHLKWSISDVANSSKISRSLVYYHFGKTKKEILMNCLIEITEEFYGMTEDRAKVSLLESLMLTHQMYKTNPVLATFYQKWRNFPSDIQNRFLDVECRYEKKLKKSFPKASQTQIKALHAVFHGLVTAPYIEQDGIRAALQLLKLESLV